YKVTGVQTCALPISQPQTPTPVAQQQQPPTIRVPVTQVIVPVTVKDRSGNLVPDLNKGDFRIFEDNVEQKIAYFSADPVPLSLRSEERRVGKECRYR